jgi:hypothetical protein
VSVDSTLRVGFAGQLFDSRDVAVIGSEVAGLGDRGADRYLFGEAGGGRVVRVTTAAAAAGQDDEREYKQGEARLREEISAIQLTELLDGDKDKIT